MLEALDVDDEHRVLEIGTGTGYNVGLLSHRLGADRVYSVDIGASLVDTARDRLASWGSRRRCPSHTAPAGCLSTGRSIESSPRAHCLRFRGHGPNRYTRE
jgi:predicted O-methyltransferase YrrM